MAEPLIERLVAKLRDPLAAFFPSYDSTRDLGRGTSFPLTAQVPGGLQEKDRFFRTDYMWPMIYDGTRWLTAEDFELRFGYTKAISATVEDYDRLQAMPSTFRPYITQWDVRFNIGATNSSSNYWQVFLRADGTTSLASTNTVGFATSSANQLRSITSFTQPSGPLIYLNPSYVKNGTAANLEAFHIIRYRYLLT